jgi:hypothetical protein
MKIKYTFCRSAFLEASMINLCFKQVRGCNSYLSHDGRIARSHQQSLIQAHWNAFRFIEKTKDMGGNFKRKTMHCMTDLRILPSNLAGPCL